MTEEGGQNDPNSETEELESTEESAEDVVAEKDEQTFDTSGVAGWTVFRPVATLMIVIAVAVFGYISYRQLPVNLMPELSYPTLTIRTELTGAAPEEVEENITKPIEEIVRTVEGVVGLSSVSRAGQSDVVLRFAWDSDMDYVTQKVRERAELVPLPEDVETPLLLRYDPSLDPIMRIGVSGDAPLAEIRRLSEDEVQRALEKVEGVAIIKVRGGLEEVVRVDLDPGRMAFLGVNSEQVAQRLASENINLAGGALSEGDVTYLVRTLNAFETIEEIQQLIVAYPEGRPVRLDQISRVYRDAREREVITRMGSDGRVAESVVVEVFKEADANLVEVSDRVRAALFGSPQELSRRAQDLARDRARRTASRARMLAEGRTGLAVSKPLGKPNFVAASMPDDVTITVLNDQATFIERSIEEAVSTAVWGGIFAVLVLFLFLRNGWTTVIIAVAIPVSVVAAFGALRLAGVTLNVMSLGGIALGIGMLVDNSIVVLESIFRCREEGDGVVEAALRGTREVAGAVTASTLTTIAVFFPIVVVEGVAGQIFGDLALSVVFALIASLAVALFFVPMLASRKGFDTQSLSGVPSRVLSYAKRPVGAWTSAKTDMRDWFAGMRDAGPIGRGVRGLATLVVVPFIVLRTVVVGLLDVVVGRLAFGSVLAVAGLLGILVRAIVGVGKVVLGWLFTGFDRVYTKLEDAYEPFLRGALRAKFGVLFIAIILFGGSLWQFDQLGTELLPTMHQGEFDIAMRMPVGTRLEETQRAVARLEKQLVEMDNVERFASTVGTERTNVQASDEGEHTARVTVRVAESTRPEDTERELMAVVRTAAQRVPGAVTEIERPALFTLQTPLEVRVQGDDLRLLRRASDDVRDSLAASDALADVRNNLGRGFPEVVVRFDRDRLAALELTARDVGEAIRDQVRGIEPTEIREREVDYDILVRTDPGEIPDVESLQHLIVRPRTADGPEIRLGAVADLTVAEGPSEIRRIEGQRAALVEADVPLMSLSAAADETKRILRALQLPAGISVDVAGQSVEMEKAREAMLFALALAIFLVYIVLASKFESFRGPFVILLSIPLALVGVVAALRVLGIDVSILVFIGLIMLAGIVVNNAIVLVDYIQQLRERGQSLDDAIVSACRIRLRPVLITTLTTILGLLPMALGLGEGAELRTPMAITVIAGLASSTLLTLLVVPVLYRVVMQPGAEVPNAAE